MSMTLIYNLGFQSPAIYDGEVLIRKPVGTDTEQNYVTVSLCIRYVHLCIRLLTYLFVYLFFKYTYLLIYLLTTVAIGRIQHQCMYSAATRPNSATLTVVY